MPPHPRTPPPLYQSNLPMNAAPGSPEDATVLTELISPVIPSSPTPNPGNVMQCDVFDLHDAFPVPMASFLGTTTVTVPVAVPVLPPLHP
ncbi:hypothetical protein PILCRDRAFT_11593 [Piloderma croceum F 1598]|uniref:Uncharacterized protein n=1 Tax=Piloderma croceum (strain F 1598) TaxID=765440 RepID=A0A0C3AVB6_PILCF|nr:hypothetical protein PILCRDRAFT_11593 [Piloderma croceum F 1598]